MFINNRARAFGAVFTLALHLAILVHFPRVVEPPKPLPVGVKPMGVDDSETLYVSKTSGSGLACGSSYRGIGVRRDWQGYLMEVVPGSPAADAGLLVGDLWVDEAQFIRDLYPIGTKVTLTIKRGPVEKKVVVTVGKICYEKS